MRHEQLFVSLDNVLRNIFGIVKTLCKIDQDQKALIFIFVYFLNASVKQVSLDERVDTLLCPHPNLRPFLYFLIS